MTGPRWPSIGQNTSSRFGVASEDEGAILCRAGKVPGRSSRENLVLRTSEKPTTIQTKINSYSFMLRRYWDQTSGFSFVGYPHELDEAAGPTAGALLIPEDCGVIRRREGWRGYLVQTFLLSGDLH
jgi:hypothetical protein